MKKQCWYFIILVFILSSCHLVQESESVRYRNRTQNTATPIAINNYISKQQQKYEDSRRSMLYYGAVDPWISCTIINMKDKIRKSWTIYNDNSDFTRYETDFYDIWKVKLFGLKVNKGWTQAIHTSVRSKRLMRSDLYYSKYDMIEVDDPKIVLTPKGKELSLSNYKLIKFSKVCSYFSKNEWSYWWPDNNMPQVYFMYIHRDSDDTKITALPATKIKKQFILNTNNIEFWDRETWELKDVIKSIDADKIGKTLISDTDAIQKLADALSATYNRSYQKFFEFVNDMIRTSHMWFSIDRVDDFPDKLYHYYKDWIRRKDTKGNSYHLALVLGINHFTNNDKKEIHQATIFATNYLPKLKDSQMIEYQVGSFVPLNERYVYLEFNEGSKIKYGKAMIQDTGKIYRIDWYQKRRLWIEHWDLWKEIPQLGSTYIYVPNDRTMFTETNTITITGHQSYIPLQPIKLENSDEIIFKSDLKGIKVVNQTYSDEDSFNTI
ncbi:MAG: hypothetical protein ACRCTJ_02205 [Brevinema sp.]